MFDIYVWQRARNAPLNTYEELPLLLTLSWRRSLSYRSQFIDFQSKSMDGLYMSDLPRERVKWIYQKQQENQLYKHYKFTTYVFPGIFWKLIKNSFNPLMPGGNKKVTGWPSFNPLMSGGLFVETKRPPDIKGLKEFKELLWRAVFLRSRKKKFMRRHFCNSSNFIRKEAPVEVFFCRFCKIF